jgi:alpha-ribazole phosphatase
MPASKQILLIRHATTDLAGKLCGHLDPALSELGRAQALSLVQSLSEVQIERIYSSDLLRSLQTAEPLARSREIAVSETQALREISFGAWEGLRWADLQARNGLALGAIESSEACPPDGESIPDFRSRVTHALNQIALECANPAAVVTHLGVIRTALTLLAGIDPGSETLRRIEYCSVFEFLVTSGTWRFIQRL